MKKNIVKTLKFVADTFYSVLLLMVMYSIFFCAINKTAMLIIGSLSTILLLSALITQVIKTKPDSLKSFFMKEQQIFRFLLSFLFMVAYTDLKQYGILFLIAVLFGVIGMIGILINFFKLFLRK